MENSGIYAILLLGNGVRCPKAVGGNARYFRQMNSLTEVRRVGSLRYIYSPLDQPQGLGRGYFFIGGHSS